jgi:hypothetical protein
MEARRQGKGVDGMGVGGPEGEDNGGAIGQVSVVEVAVVNFVTESRRIENRLGPGNEVGQGDGVGVGVVLEGAGAGDGVVEGGEAEVEALGFGVADEVVFDQGEPGEAEEGLGGGFGFGGILNRRKRRERRGVFDF